jgi:hypothetical protein
MKVTSFLIVWLLPLLQAGGYGQSPCRGYASRTHAEAHVASSMVLEARHVSFPDGPSSGSLGASFEDEEDSLEDGFLDGGLLLSRSWRDLARGGLASFAHLRHDLLRIPFHAHPLRC